MNRMKESTSCGEGAAMAKPRTGKMLSAFDWDCAWKPVNRIINKKRHGKKKNFNPDGLDDLDVVDVIVPDIPGKVDDMCGHKNNDDFDGLDHSVLDGQKYAEDVSEFKMYFVLMIFKLFQISNIHEKI